MKKYLDIMFGILLILYIIIINIISSTKIAFSTPIIIVGIALILFHFTKEIIKESEVWVEVFKKLKILVCIGFICFLGIEGAIIVYPKHNTEKADYIIVLGAGLSNGTTPSLILEGRLDAAINYMKKNENGYIVLSGGKGSDENIPESQAMSKYLLERGIAKNQIIIEDKSRNTDENFRYSKEKIEEHSGKTLNELSVKIITTDFHALRSSILAKKNGYANYNNYSSSTVWYLIPITYTREAFAIIKSLIFD